MMKFRLVRWIWTIVLCGCFTAAIAQPYHKLTIDDFRGIANTNSGDGYYAENIAYISCPIEYSYTAHKENNYYILNFTVVVKVDNDKSWLDKNKVRSTEALEEILKHEQGHYNLAYLEQQELLRTVSHTIFYGDYQHVAGDIFNRINAKYQQLNLDYDNDTQNMTNRIQQHSWDMYFKKRLGVEYLAKN